MFEIDPITMYRTADGHTFEEYDDAVDYEIRCAAKEIMDDDLIVKDKKGRQIKFYNIYANCDEIFFFTAKTEKALNFLRECLDAQGVVNEDFPEEVGTYRWDEDYECWTTVGEDLERFVEKWVNYGYEIRKVILNELIT